MSKFPNKTIEDILFDAVILTDDAIGIFDEKDVVVFCNKPFASIFGFDDSEVLGRTFSDIIRSCFEKKVGVIIATDDIDAWLAIATSKRRSKPFRAFEVDTIDGRWHRLTELLVGNHMFTYATDVTASKNLEMELTRTKHKLQQLASTDHLTGIYNRRQFNKLASKELERCGRNQLHATLMLLDIDNFKDINDTHGHACGDSILVHFTDRIKGELRSYDIFARIGGEEFAILLPEVDTHQALLIAERYRQKIADIPFYYESEYITVTTSIGLSESYPKIKTLDYALKGADKNLYMAKQDGRNLVVGP